MVYTNCRHVVLIAGRRPEDGGLLVGGRGHGLVAATMAAGSNSRALLSDRSWWWLPTTARAGRGRLSHLKTRARFCGMIRRIGGPGAKGPGLKYNSGECGSGDKPVSQFEIKPAYTTFQLHGCTCTLMFKRTYTCFLQYIMVVGLVRILPTQAMLN